MTPIGWIAIAAAALALAFVLKSGLIRSSGPAASSQSEAAE